MLGAMELRHLRYFVAVAEEESVTRAAARLHVSQPPLSRQIRDLEEELGVTLLERGANSVKLTEAGAMFLDEARAVLQRATEAVEAVKAIADGGRRSFRLGYAPSLTVELLPAALREFERLSPGMKVSLHDLSTEEMLSGLRDKSIQAALMIHSTSPSAKGIRFTELKRYAACVAFPSSHPMATGPRPPIAAVFADRIVAYTREDYPEYHRWLDRLAPESYRIAEEHDSSSSLIAAVEAGRGVALVPESFACFAGARVVVRPLAGRIRPFIVVAATGEQPPAVAEAFVEAAQSAASKLSAPLSASRGKGRG